MADVFKEVDEELRRENLAKLWNKYGYAIIGLAVGIVVAVAAVQGWRAYDQDQRETLSDRYAAALDIAAAGDTVSALDTFSDLSDAESGGYGGLAAFEEARLRVESGDVDGAIAIWDRIAAGSDLGSGFRPLASLLSIMHQIDSADPDSLRARLEPLAAEDQPFRATARELLATLALRQGDRAAARELYTQIADDRQAPSGLVQRAAQMLQALKD